MPGHQGNDCGTLGHAGIDARFTCKFEDDSKHGRDALYSMDGDYPELQRFVDVKNKHKAWLYVDDAHSIGTLGETGRGLAEVAGVDRKDVELWMGTLSKSLGSCGGFVGGAKQLIDYLRYTTPGYVFAAGIPFKRSPSTGKRSKKLAMKNPSVPSTKKMAST